MPLFRKENDALTLIKQIKFSNEKELQKLIETNIKEIFNCSFIATEFVTGSVHRGRIDTLGISEDNNPVIIEYKVNESSQLVNQSLFYLAWIKDHQGDFEIAVQKAFPNKDIKIDWNNIRVICIAPEFKKYDIHAVTMMDSNIELWQYRYFENGALFFEEIYRKSVSSMENTKKDPIMVQAGKKGIITRSKGVYDFEEHIKKINNQKKSYVLELQEYILSMDEAVEEVPKKLYIAYKISQNFVCMEIHKNKILLYLKVDPKTIDVMQDNCRDVSNIGHYGTGDFEVTINDENDLEIAKYYIQLSFNNIGGN